MSARSSTGYPDDFFATLHDAAVVRTPPWLALVGALASVRPESPGAAIDWLVANRDEIERTFAEGRKAPLAIAELAPELRYAPELGGLDRAKNDHALRDKYLFADFVGKRTFMQTAVFAITGLELSPSDAEMMEQLGVANVAVDQRAWPLAATRRVAARGGGIAAAIVAGNALMGAPIIGPSAGAGAARFLVWVQAELAKGQSLPDVIDGMLARHEKAMGFGRPAVGPDERSPVMEAIAIKYGRGAGPNVRLVRAIDEELGARRGLRSTAAAWAAGILADVGLTPEAIHAVTALWVSPCVFGQAVYADERGTTGVARK